MTSSAPQSAPAPDGRSAPWRSVANTLRTRYFPAVLGSNLLQFTAYHAHLTMLLWLVTSLTDSRTLLGLVPFVQGAVVFATSPIAGVAVDRVPRRNVLIGARAGLAAIVLGIALLVALHTIEIWHILLSAVFAGLLTSFAQPASQTYVFDVVERENAPNAVTLNAAATRLGEALGPLWGGGLVAVVGFVAAYVSAALGLGLAAVLLVLVPLPGRSPAPEARASWFHDLRGGLAYVRAHPPVLMALVATSMAVFNGAVSALRPAIARHLLGVGSEGYGGLAGAAGLAGLVTALTMAALPAARRPGLWMVGSMLGYSLGVLLYSLVLSYEYLLAVEVAMGVCGQIWMVSTFSGLQMAVPDEMRGRIVSLVFMLVMLAPIGALAVGALADAIGDQPALAIFGALPTTALALILLLGFRQLREL